MRASPVAESPISIPCYNQQDHQRGCLPCTGSFQYGGYDRGPNTIPIPMNYHTLIHPTQQHIPPVRASLLAQATRFLSTEKDVSAAPSAQLTRSSTKSTHPIMRSFALLHPQTQPHHAHAPQSLGTPRQGLRVWVECPHSPRAALPAQFAASTWKLPRT